jgi:hypothetical protein
MVVDETRVFIVTGCNLQVVQALQRIFEDKTRAMLVETDSQPTCGFFNLVSRTFGAFLLSPSCFRWMS